MDVYEKMADELIDLFDRRKKKMRHDKISAAMHGEMAVLRLLDEEEDALTAGEISRLLQMTTSRIAAVLGTLEKKGLILRHADAQDRRRVRVMLTQEGRALCRMKRQRLTEDVRYTFSQLGEQDAREFVRLFKRVEEIMPAPPPPMKPMQCGMKPEALQKDFDHEDR